MVVLTRIVDLASFEGWLYLSHDKGFEQLIPFIVGLVKMKTIQNVDGFVG